MLHGGGSWASKMFESIWFPTYWNSRLTRLADIWFENAGKCLGNNRLPLSGDVLQWISTMGVMFGQFGLINMNLMGSRNPLLERLIGSRYSYGSQLGRMLEILEPLVEAQADQLLAGEHAPALVAFREMAEDVRRYKLYFG